MNMMAGKKKKGQSSLGNGPAWVCSSLSPQCTQSQKAQLKRRKEGDAWYCLHDYAVWIALPLAGMVAASG